MTAQTNLLAKRKQTITIKIVLSLFSKIDNNQKSFIIKKKCY